MKNGSKHLKRGTFNAEFYSYAERISLLHNDTVYVSKGFYSQTTTKHCNKVYRYFKEETNFKVEQIDHEKFLEIEKEWIAEKMKS